MTSVSRGRTNLDKRGSGGEAGMVGAQEDKGHQGPEEDTP
jgi:hypothetical protein